jgi:hypothetical protein
VAKNKRKSKRKRDWASEKTTEWPAEWQKFAAEGGTPFTNDLGELVKWLKIYTADLAAWGQDVRDDIVRLEGYAGFASGDPGDPPAGPPD